VAAFVITTRRPGSHSAAAVLGNESPLKELELGGKSWTPYLRQLARHALRRRFTDGVIDELLSKEKINYQDITAASAAGGDEAPSMLKTILPTGSSEAQIAAWLANASLDATIEDKEATAELGKLVRARLGLELLDGVNLSKWRAITARFVLAVEFRSDLSGERHVSSTPCPRQRRRWWTEPGQSPLSFAPSTPSSTR